VIVSPALAFSGMSFGVSSSSLLVSFTSSGIFAFFGKVIPLSMSIVLQQVSTSSLAPTNCKSGVVNDRCIHAGDLWRHVTGVSSCKRFLRSGETWCYEISPRTCQHTLACPRGACVRQALSGDPEFMPQQARRYPEKITMELASHQGYWTF
jgi:hypothetical protein